MKKSSDKQLAEVLAWLSKSKTSIPELDLIKKLDLDSTWYAQTFRGDGLVNSVYNDQNDKHMITLSAKGVSLLSDLTKSWHERLFGFIVVGVVIGVIVSVVSLVLEKKWDFFSQIFKSLFA